MRKTIPLNGLKHEILKNQNISEPSTTTAMPTQEARNNIELIKNHD